MSFLSPIAPLASLAFGIGGAIGAKKLTGPTPAQQQAQNLLNSNAQQAASSSTNAVNTGANLLSEGQSTRNTGMNFINQFSSTLGSPSSYFQSLLSGNPTQSTAALAPDIARNRQAAQSTIQSTSTLSPRGAGRSATLFDLPFRSEAATSGLYNSLRPQAANALTNIAGLQGQVGSNILNSGTSLTNSGVGAINAGANFLNAGTSAASDIAKQEQDRLNEQFKQQQALGYAFSTAISQVKNPFGGKTGSSGSTGGTQDGYNPGDPWVFGGGLGSYGGNYGG